MGASCNCRPSATAASRPRISLRLAPAAGSSTSSPLAPAFGALGSIAFARTVAIAGEDAKA